MTTLLQFALACLLMAATASGAPLATGSDTPSQVHLAQSTATGCCGMTVSWATRAATAGEVLFGPSATALDIRMKAPAGESYTYVSKYVVTLVRQIRLKQQQQQLDCGMSHPLHQELGSIFVPDQRSQMCLGQACEVPWPCPCRCARSVRLTHAAPRYTGEYTSPVIHHATLTGLSPSTKVGTPRRTLSSVSICVCAL